MGFGGGGSNVTKPHTHDSTIVQDGGSLAPNVTQFGLSAGSILYSDGSNIQELTVASASDELRVNAGASAPEWYTPAPAGASTWTQLGHTTTTTSVDGYNVLKVSFTATLADYSEIVGIGNMTPGANSYGWRVNDLAGTAYDYSISTVGFSTGTDDQGQSSQDMWKFGRYLVGTSAAQLEIHIQRNDNYGDYLTATGACAGNSGMCSAGGILNADVDTMTSLSICSEAEDLPAGQLTVYGVTIT
jgi:hypothetical protein